MEAVYCEIEHDLRGELVKKLPKSGEVWRLLRRGRIKSFALILMNPKMMTRKKRMISETWWRSRRTKYPNL